MNEPLPPAKPGLDKQSFTRATALAELPDAGLELLHQAASWHEVPSEHALIRAESGVGHGVFLLFEGAVDIVRDHDDGRRVKLASKKPVELIGELGAITGKPGSASAITRLPSLIASIPANTFRQVTHDYPRVALDLLDSLAQNVRLLDAEIARLGLAEQVLERLYTRIKPWT